MKIKLTIGRKLAIGFGVVLLLLVAVGAVGFLSNMNAGQSLNRVNQVADDTGLGADATAALLRGQTSVKNFLLTSDPVEIDAYREASEQFKAIKAEARSHFTDAHRLDLVAQIEADFKTYDTAFNEVAEIVLRSDDVKKQTLDVIGPQATNALKKQFYDVAEAGQSELAYRITPPLLDLLEGRLYVMKYVRTTNADDFDRAVYEFSASASKLQKVIDDFPEIENTSSLTQLREQVIAYEGAVRELRTLIQQRDRIMNEKLTVLGPKIVKTQHDIQDSLLETSHTVAEAADERIVMAEIIIVTVCGVAVLIGLAACFFITRLIVKPVRHYLAQVAKVGEGDLTAQIDATQNDEIGEMGRGINGMIETMSDLISNVQLTSHEVAGAATELAATSEEMAHTMDEQSNRINSVSTAMVEMDQAVQDVARKTADASSNADRSGRTAREGGEVVRDTVAGMDGIKAAVGESADAVQSLGQRGEQIGEIIAVINDIADQTNLLALNAAIEAARAGEHGRGFAVVADEVRKLADRTTQATDEISSSISAIQDETSQAVDRMNTGLTQVEAGVTFATQAGESLEEIVANTDEVASMIQSIAAATEQQSATSEQINNNLESTVAAIRESAEATNQASTAVNQLSIKAEELQRLIGRFKLEKAS
ncbi:MAG: methyl-accepting chemotaxis protein [Planctomycetota bacterium]